MTLAVEVACAACGSFAWSSLRKPPRGMPAIGARPIQADRVVRWVTQPGFAPQPLFISRQLIEIEAKALQCLDPCIQVLALEVDDNTGVRRNGLDVMHGDRGVAFDTLESGVSWNRIHDQPEAERFVEGDRLLHVDCRQGDLIEVHRLKRCQEGFWGPMGPLAKVVPALDFSAPEH